MFTRIPDTHPKLVSTTLQCVKVRLGVPRHLFFRCAEECGERGRLAERGER